MSIQRKTNRRARSDQDVQPVEAAPAAGDGFPGTYPREREAVPGADGADEVVVSPSAAPGSASTSFVGDPYWGRGGRYIVGADGARRPAKQED